VQTEARRSDDGRHVGDRELGCGRVSGEIGADVRANFSRTIQGSHRCGAESAGAECLLPEDDVDALRLLAAARHERAELCGAMCTDEALGGNARVALIDRDVSDDTAGCATRGILGAGGGGNRKSTQNEHPRERTREVGHSCLGTTSGGGTSEEGTLVGTGRPPGVMLLRCTAYHERASNTTRSVTAGAAFASHIVRSRGAHAGATISTEDDHSWRHEKRVDANTVRLRENESRVR